MTAGSGQEPWIGLHSTGQDPDPDAADRGPYDAAGLTWTPAAGTGTAIGAVLYGPTPHRWWSWRRWIGAARGQTWHLWIDLDPDCPPGLTPGPGAGSVSG